MMMARLSVASSYEVLAQTARHIATVSLAAHVLIVLDHHYTATDHGVDLAVDDRALVCRIVHVHVMGLDADARLRVGVVDDDVGIGAGRQHTLLRIQAEHASGRRGTQLDPPGQPDLTVHDTLIDGVHAVLDAADAVGNLREVADAHLL